mgnify:FL=1
MRKEKLEELNDYIKELQTITKERKKEDFIYQGTEPVQRRGFINVESYNCKLQNGIIISREKIVKGASNGNAVIIFPVTKEGNTLLVVQPRVFTKETVCVELPAGYLEKDEDPLTAGKRELEEETGYVPEEMRLLASFYQDQGCSAAYNHSMLALGCKKIKEQNLDKDEIIRYFECSFDEAVELVERGYITDIQSQFTMEKAKPYVYKK